MAASMNFNDVKQRFNVSELQRFQMDTLEHLLKGQDVFLSVKTGGGKSLCYQAFQMAWCSMNNCSETECMVLVIAPLISIMKEQCEFLNDLGYTSTYIGKDSNEDVDIQNGKYQFLFSSPEQLLSNPKWRDMILSSTGKRIKLLAVDEAHTILQWGEADSDQEAFRSWFGRLGELRSLLECPALLITATANKSARKYLQQKFCMINCFELVDNPDRSNIKLFVSKCKSSEPLKDVFAFLLHMLTKQGQNSDRYVIFCQSIKTCGDLYSIFRLELGANNSFQHVQMYHSSTTDTVKEKIKNDLSDPNGNIRILIATSAAGMGVNFNSIKGVINFGPPKDMDSFVQQFGRAGRSGDQATALLLYNARQCRNLDSDMQAYIFNNSMCRREKLLSFYNATKSSSLNMFKHVCCDLCAKSCLCDVICPDLKHPYLELKHHDYSSESDVTSGDEELLSDSN